ncbi:MAG: Brp/Blh family beta-carotene 15,15'-dioxygenase [Saprospiraceae bacterium]
MREKTLQRYNMAPLITLTVIVISLIFPQFISGYAWHIALVLIILLGIPHGATDHLIFLQLSRPLTGTKNLDYFYPYYLLLMALYGLVWWLSPTFAFGIFLTISVYHFGQSNWAEIIFPDKISAALTYLCWGSFVLFLPILWHFAAAAPIIGIITGKAVPSLAPGWSTTICLTLLTLNVWLVFYWWTKGVLTVRLLQRELMNLLTLSALFFSTPLLLGFAIYFVVWHSLGSANDQIHFFKTRRSAYSWKHYLRQTLPLSVVAIAGLGFLYWLKTLLGLQPHIGILFIFISVITLPHMILMDQLYDEWQHSGELSDTPHI